MNGITVVTKACQIGVTGEFRRWLWVMSARVIDGKLPAQFALTVTERRELEVVAALLHEEIDRRDATSLTEIIVSVIASFRVPGSTEEAELMVAALRSALVNFRFPPSLRPAVDFGSVALQGPATPSVPLRPNGVWRRSA